ncbi:intermembrane lipid transfer protein VPS13B [Toxorhynchites rutilus septentrionalis]|uniref:intermembrane lipid transfer protein VPS13B n=1 Tax=Toxorhynchites rutilus septentrionalis TaxID=329112 RepID=UPI00247B1B88|nr:intermembrane lipid transfer protein VPS13B [Toxorhynchites rutilus septentrionalis]
MFKIESYITPIILSYVEKYVKNIRPEDSQVSLWGGEVVFQNLDLKLDVLEEELALPFQFLSGHIHELAIRVPWTKIASEPIVITINTIEFVLKLQEPGNRTAPRRDASRKNKNTEETPPPGYMASLINRIANNITIRCHNVILKYVEEDIVVSMNIQQFSMESADNGWNPAFIDISPLRVSLRKLINIVDLTICLDKRNSAGKIEVCQEPVLYRSTLQARVLMKYNNVRAQDRSSITRIDIHSKFLDVNVSSQQFPMLMRLFELGLALKQGKIKSETSLSQDGNADGEREENQESLISWAWNLLPSFFPEESENDHTDDNECHVFHAGCYVDRLRMIFKTQELVGESVVGTARKIKYNPFLQLNLEGVHGEVLICGLKWFNVCGGVAEMSIQSLEDCPCGHPPTVQDIFQSESHLQSANHTEGSFFDTTCEENAKYNINWNYHLGTYSQDVLLQRSPSFAVDIVHEVQVPDDRRTSEFGSDLEFSNLSEKYMIRAFMGKFRLKVNADTLHRIKTFISYKDAYEYPPYYEEKPFPTIQQLPPPSAEDYDALMSEIPLKQVHVTILNPTIELHAFDHSKFQLGRKRSTQATQNPSNPYLTLEFNRVECNLLTPLYPNRLVFTTSQLPEPPSKLFDSCFHAISGNLERLQVKIHHNDWEILIATSVNLNHQHRFLLFPDLWPNSELNKTEHNFGVSDLKLVLNPQKALIASAIVQSLHYQCASFHAAPNTLNDLTSNAIPTLDLSISHSHMRKILSEHTICWKLTSRSLRCLSYIPNNFSSQRSLTALWPDHPTDEDFLTAIIQLPIDNVLADLRHPPLFYGRFLDLSLNMDPILYDFLRIIIEQNVASHENPLVRSHTRHSLSPRKSVDRLLPKKSSQPITSVHSSSDKVETLPPAAAMAAPALASSVVAEDDTEREDPDAGRKATAGWDFWKQLSRRIIFHLEFNHCTVYFPEKSIVQDTVGGSGRPEDEFGDNEIVMLKLPLITINSAFKSGSLSARLNRFPISLAKSVWPDDKDSFPWTISLADASSWTYQGRQMSKLLDEMTTNISLVFNIKEEDGIATSACFHVDTSPLKLNVFKEQLALITATVDRILSIPSLQSSRGGESGGRKELQQLEISQKSASTAPVADLKEFLDMTHNSSGASEKTLKETIQPNKLQVSVWLQWTFSKVTVNCIVRNDENRSIVKLVIELEDIIYSLDMQEVYLQVKAKVGGMSGHCYEYDEEKASWVKNEALGLTVQTESGGSSKSANDTFLNLTVTKAETTNVHSKWDAVKKNREQNESLVEIILKVEQIDLRLDLDLLEQCVDVLAIFQRKNEIQEPRSVLGVRDLPLILFNSKGLRLFIPLQECSGDCSAYIFKINSIIMHHNVENPICRVPLRPDVYTKAAQMRILNVPGSKIEDRQYELVLKEISLSTARWSDIQAYIEEQTSTTKHHDNPAFEWNNLQEAQRSTDFEVSTIFKEFNFSVIYAPCIIYKNVLICSQAMELNCMSDLLIDLDLDQLHLAGMISRRVNQILQIMCPPDQQSCSSQGSFVEINPTLFASQASQEAMSVDSSAYTREPDPPRFRRSHSKLSKCEEDSGVESYRASDVKRIGSSSRRSMEGSRQRMFSERLIEQAKPSTGATIDQQIVPYEICFLGGYFKVNLYEKKTAENVPKTLLRMIMAQPNGMLSLNLLERIIQVSLFDLVIELQDVPLLKTLSGEPDDLGIPQPLIKTRFVKSLTKMNNELSVDFKRPIKLAISHQRLDVLLELISLLDTTICGPRNEVHTGKRPSKHPKPILGRNKFKQLKSNLYDVEKVNLRLSQIMIHLRDDEERDYNCKLSFSSIDASLLIQERPERITFTLMLEELVFCQRCFVIVHPFSFNATATLTQEYWKRDPLVHVKLSSSYLQLDFNPKNMAEMRAVSDHFCRILMANSGNTREDCQKQERDSNANPPTLDPEKLIPIVTPGFSRKDSKVTPEEHYQDDLRAGAFQFIESTRLNDLPLPYQIKITNRDIGTICWRYPQPRALYSVTVYPVPMSTTKTINIQCKLEYFSEIHGDFFELCGFTLSENEKVQLKLPARITASSIWRIVMTHNVVCEGEGGGSEDEEHSPTNDSTDQSRSLISNITDVLKDTYLSTSRTVNLPYRLHPKIFVACMRVDSLFNPDLIPNVEFTAELRPVQVNLFNVVEFEADAYCLPKPFERYRVCKETLESKSHKFIMLNANHLRTHGAIYDSGKVMLSGELNLHCDLLDYSHFTFENLLEVVNVKAVAVLEDDLVELTAISDDIRIRYGPSIGYNLLVADKIWNSNEGSALIFGKFIVCNHTHVGLKFGQFETGESIFLGTGELSLYVFRSVRHQQQLQLFFNENTKDIASVPFAVAKVGLVYVRILPAYEEDVDDDKLFIVRIENLSNVQKRITIEGQISFFNMTSQQLKLQYRFYKLVANNDKHYLSTSVLVEGNSSANVFGAANSKNQQSIKISIDGEKKGWSGDIPMREIMNGAKPYLVKIPTGMTKEGYISYWVRIIRERIDETADMKGACNERVLVIIWPLFMVQSMLTVNTTAHEEKNDRTFSIYGQAERRQLIVSGTNTDEHELLFRMNFYSPHGEDKRRALLSYRIIDGRTFFQVPERFKKVENAISMLQNCHIPNWPCSREDELRCKRENSIQEATFPLYNCSAPHELSCCLMLSIAPWCLFINKLGCQVRVKNFVTNEVDIVEPNNIVMPHYIESAFTLELNVGFLLQSELIYISGEVKRQASNSYVVPTEGTVVINLRSENGITNLILSSTTENNIRVLILASQFVIVNYSSFDLRCWSFGVLPNERLDQILQDTTGTHTACLSLPRNDRKCENPQGVAITVANNLSKHKNKLKFTSNYNYFLTLYQNDDSDFSTPIHLNRTVSRKSFCVQCNDRYIPLSLSIIAHLDQHYVSIYDDQCPSFAVENRTDFNIYVAQSDSTNVNKSATAIPECGAESNFVWYQIVGSRKTVYYTPPTLDAIYPETQEVDIALLFACVSGSAIRWSNPVKPDENKNIFLNIPLYGDLKLTVNIRNRTTEILIDYISQNLEFSAKDIRTRLLNPIPQSVDRCSDLESDSPPAVDDQSNTSMNTFEQSLQSKRISFRGFFKSLNLTLFRDDETNNCSKTDLISFSFDRVGVEMNSGVDNGRALLQFVNVQVDNDLHSTGEYDFPVILCSEDHEDKQRKVVVIPNQYGLDDCLKELSACALCSIYAEMDASSWPNFEGLRFKINPIRAYVEDTYINILLDYLMECLPINLLYQPETQLERIRCSPGQVLVPRMVIQQSSYLAEPVKLRYIRIEPLHVLLSVHTCMRLYIALDHSPLDFAAFERNNIRSIPMRFGNSLGMHYLSGAIFGGGWVIGSLEILGSPSGLARSVTSGLRDFVSLPVQGLFRGPWGFLVGLTQGSTSLIRNITAGTVNSVTKLATSVARNLDRLTLDSEHVQRTDALRRRRPQGMTEGFTQGLTGLGISILGAVGGLAHHPMQARNPIGVVTGVGKGIVGAFTKPISGAAELLALTGQGMLHSVGYNTMPMPKYDRQPIQRLEQIPYKTLWEPQALGEGSLLFTIHATFVSKNQYALVVVGLYSRSLVLLDVDHSQLLEVLDLKTVYPSIDAADPTSMLLRIRPELPPPPTDYMSYPISSRTYQFVQESTMQLPKLSHYTMQPLVRASRSVAIDRIQASTPPFMTTPVGVESSERPPVLEDDEMTAMVPPTSRNCNDVIVEIEDNIEQLTSLEDDVPSIEDSENRPDDNERRLVLYLEEKLARYLVKYVNLLKKCQQPAGTVAFAPFDSKM